MQTKDWIIPQKDDEELARLSLFVRDIAERIMMEFHCEWWFAIDAAMDLHSFLELSEKKRKKKISPNTADAGLIEFSNN
jgi:hypothetical protein